jgi:hypothetical protein
MRFGCNAFGRSGRSDTASALDGGFKARRASETGWYKTCLPKGARFDMLTQDLLVASLGRGPERVAPISVDHAQPSFDRFAISLKKRIRRVEPFRKTSRLIAIATLEPLEKKIETQIKKEKNKD